VVARHRHWPPGARLMARQLAAAWVCGSVLMGTVAWGFLSAEGTAIPQPVPVRESGGPAGFSVLCPGPLACGHPSFFVLSPLARLAVLALVVLLFAALAVLSWWTSGASWLTGDARARLLWVLLVGAGGLLGWSYAAVITFAAGFGSAAQLVLAYTAGGLPFALVAGMLLRPWRANVVAGGVSAGLVAAGFLMVAGHPVPQNAFMLYADYARAFFAGHGPILD
jgi:hypothetical protein